VWGVAQRPGSGAFARSRSASPSSITFSVRSGLITACAHLAGVVQGLAPSDGHQSGLHYARQSVHKKCISRWIECEQFQQ
jgi:hypothetical protein